MSNYLITHDTDACVACGICAAFCPTDVFTLFDDARAGSTGVAAIADAPEPIDPAVPGTRLQVTDIEACCGCDTCVAQCPKEALKMEFAPGAAGVDVDALGRPIAANPLAGLPKADPLPAERVAELAEWAKTLKEVLGLRWEPVAITLLAEGAPVPDVPVPKESLRYCQQLMHARRGIATMLPSNRHSCPDGTSILGLTEVPEKLASGEIYLLFHKLDSIEAAQRMVGERPHLEPHSVEATVACPLAKAACEPEVVFVTCTPEQTMWLCMSAAYYTGHRFEFHASGYNSLCVETTLYPREHGVMNISFGCYGVRAASDVEDESMFVGIPVEMMPTVVKGLRELTVKAIPQSRSRCYLPPRL